jgi:hypothetical protein
MRLVILCVAILFVVGTAARADEEDPYLSVTEAKPLRDRWQDCTAAAVKRHLESSKPAEDIADLALSSCKSRETALANVLGRRLGAAAARRIVADLRGYDRLVLTRIIERLRAR